MGVAATGTRPTNWQHLEGCTSPTAPQQVLASQRASPHLHPGTTHRSASPCYCVSPRPCTLASCSACVLDHAPSTHPHPNLAKNSYQGRLKTPAPGNLSRQTILSIFRNGAQHTQPIHTHVPLPCHRCPGGAVLDPQGGCPPAPVRVVSWTSGGEEDFP